jgi:hypothetical protein
MTTLLIAALAGAAILVGVKYLVVGATPWNATMQPLRDWFASL